MGGSWRPGFWRFERGLRGGGGGVVAVNGFRQVWMLKFWGCTAAHRGTRPLPQVSRSPPKPCPLWERPCAAMGRTAAPEFHSHWYCFPPRNLAPLWERPCAAMGRTAAPEFQPHITGRRPSDQILTALNRVAPHPLGSPVPRLARPFRRRWRCRGCDCRPSTRPPLRSPVLRAGA